MAQFTDNTDSTKGKPVKTVVVPVMTNEENLDDLREIVESLPDSFSAEVTNVSASSGVVDFTVTYTGKGANIEHVKRVLRKGGLEFVTKRPKTVKEGDDS